MRRQTHVVASPVLTATYVGGATDSLTLLGKVEERMAKLSTWLKSSGFKESAPVYSDEDKSGATNSKVVTFSRADVPF